jgi:flavin-dependent dehydrogenase
VFDQWLVDEAVAAGVHFEDGVTIRDVAINDNRVAGVVASGADGRALTHSAKIVIAADGRRSAIAIGRRLSQQPRRPRRWAIGGYFTNVSDMAPFGEMHVRRGHYIGVAPLPGGVTNACLVVPQPSRGRFGEAGSYEPSVAKPDEFLRTFLRSDEQLKDRFGDARPVDPPVVLGPMAVNAMAAGEPGLLLAGDAAGFIDPMTGDGMRFAFVGAELAANVAQEVIAGSLPVDRAHLELAQRRHDAFSAKWRFNRTMRSLVA